MGLSTYKIVTFGCQMNAYDSEVMAGILEARGLKQTESELDADVLLINTCIVRGSAEQRAMGHIGRLKSVKERHPERIFGVCGCMAQRDAATLFQLAPHIDLVLGTRAIPKLSGLLDHLMAQGEPVACVEDCEDPYHSDTVPVRMSSLRALVNVIYGCNNWCSYCIVPAVRGREKSRPAGIVLDEIEALVQTGCREVTLIGQNVNSYQDGEVGFDGLLERVNNVRDLWRIRYITSHPRDACKGKHVEAVASLEKVCDHFHLPVQSGSTPVLEKMNRGYDRAQYEALIEKIRTSIPGATITTDVIVGFPGESDSDYEQTLDLVRQVRFDSAFTFLYTPREGARSAAWEDDVPLAVKKERLARLIAAQERISLEKNQDMIGKRMEILVEGPARRAEKAGGNQLMGRTTGDKCVIFEGQTGDIANLVEVKITGGAAHTLFGERIGRVEKQ